MSKKYLKSWALLRFSIIGPLLAHPPDRGELRKQLESLARQSYQHPRRPEEWITFDFSTLERWYYRALGSNDPVGALGRKIRVDAGEARVLSPALLEILHRQYRDYPQWSYQLHSDNLAALIKEQPNLGDVPSYSTVRRGMKQRGWIKKAAPRHATRGQVLAAERLEQREVRSFEAQYVHGLWHLDFHEGRRKVIDAKGVWHKPKALCIVDDRSRLCCHIQWYLNETADCLIHGLTQAFFKRGLPRSLMSDNGSAMLAQETENGCARLGIVHEKTLAYSPYQNGKQETFWGQLEGRLMAMLAHVEPLSLEFLNMSTQAWVEQEYNRSHHEEIKTSPLNRLLEGPSVSRPCPDAQAIRFAFTMEERRSQRRSDGTIRIKGVRFEVPTRFRHFEKLCVRYQSWDLSSAYLIDERTGELIARLSPQDKAKNSSGARRNLEVGPPENAKPAPGPTDPIPPLLRKLLADYAATGLPPAYIPKEEDAKQNGE